MDEKPEERPLEPEEDGPEGGADAPSGEEIPEPHEAEEAVEVEAEPVSPQEANAGRTIDVDPEAPPESEAERESSASWSMAAHLTTLFGLLNFVFPAIGTVVALVVAILIWQTKLETLPKAAEAAKESVNFQINLVFWSLISWLMLPTCCLTPVGIVLWAAVVLASVVLPILGAIQVANGSKYDYPAIYRVL